MSHDVLVLAGSAQLDGTLDIPEGARGLVVFAHGSGSSRHSRRNQFVARVIRESGIGTLLFDLLTPAEEVQDNLTGALRFDIGLLAERLLAATRWVNGKADLQQMAVGYFGASTGGGAALVAAAELSHSIAAVVSRGGRPDLAGQALHAVRAPTLLIVGECDEVVVRLNQEAYDKLRCDKELRIVPRATHLFEEPGALQEVGRLAASWFQGYLSAADAKSNAGC